MPNMVSFLFSSVHTMKIILWYNPETNRVKIEDGLPIPADSTSTNPFGFMPKPFLHVSS
jgi:hypothetical protein